MDNYFEEEEFEGQIDNRTLVRMARLTFKHWPLLILFLASIGSVAFIEAYLTFISKRIIDEGIVPKDTDMLWQLVFQYGLWSVGLAVGVAGFIHGRQHAQPLDPV